MSGNPQGYVTNQDFDAYKRFHKEQFENMALQILEIRKMLENLQPPTPIPAQTKALLTKQVDNMFREIQFLHGEIAKLKKV